MYENDLPWTSFSIHAIANTKNNMYDNRMKRHSRPPRAILPPDVRPRVNYANYFAVRNGQRRWGPRTIADVELILVVAGEFAYESAGETWALQDGDVLCIPPGIEHVFAHRRDRSYGAVISCIHLELAPGRWRAGDYRPEPMPPPVTSTHGDMAIHPLFRHCRDVFEGNLPYREELLGTIARNLWLRLAGYWEGHMRPGPSLRTARMVAAIERGLPGVVTRHDLAREFGLGPEHVNALLRKEIGLTPTQIRHRALIVQACRLLQEEGLSVKEAAARTGFHDEFHFAKVFKRVMGFPPGVFKAGRQIMPGAGRGHLDAASPFVPVGKRGRGT